MSNLLHEIYGPGFSEMSACRWRKQAHPPAAIPCYHGISNRDASCATWEDVPEPCHPGLSCCSSGSSGWAKAHESAGAMMGYGPGGDASGTCPMRRSGQCPFGAAGSADGSMAAGSSESGLAAGASCGAKHEMAGAMACSTCPFASRKAAGALACSSCQSK